MKGTYLTRTAPAAAVMCFVIGMSGAAQGLQTPAVPRTPDGRPDLQGIWQAMTEGGTL